MRGGHIECKLWRGKRAEVYSPALMQNGQQHPYGFGWFLGSAHGKPWYQHCGSWQGFRACISRYLDDDLTIVVLANLAEANPAHIIDGIGSLIDPELPKIPHK